MFGFIKRVLGGQPAAAQVPVNSDPFGREAEQPPVASVGVSDGAAGPSAVPSRPAVVLQRDEIIDAKTRIGGYRFSARRPESAGEVDAGATVAVLANNGVAAFAERRLALIPLTPADWERHDYRALIGPHTAFLLAPPAPGEDASVWVAVAQAIQAAGARLATTDGADPALIREYADLLVVDFSAYDLPRFEQLLSTLARDKPALQVVADRVGRWPEFRYCIAHRMAYCLGPFTTEPEEDQARGEIGQSRLVLIEMLNQLRREADLAAITEVAKRDPGVVVKLVAMANSPLAGLSQPVTSIDQAIMVLGRQQLYRWVSIALFRAGSTSPRDEVLLELALARGRFLELIGQGRQDKAGCDELFLLGLLSLLDSLLGMPMSAVVDRLHLSADLREVLVNSSGPLGRYLLLAIAVEKGRADHVGRLAEGLAIPLAEVEDASAEALGWADEAVQQTA